MAILTFEQVIAKQRLERQRISQAFDFWASSEKPATDSDEFFSICDQFEIEPGDLNDAIQDSVWDDQTQWHFC